ncbi:MAG: hypothetical protein U1E76_26505 [Planctomycetota bacterium]
MRLGLPCTLVAVACITLNLAPAARASVGPDLQLAVTPDTPVGAGDTVSLNLSDGTFFDLALLLGGQTLGSTPFGELTLDLVPELFLFLGFFPSDGTIAFDAQLPSNLPPELSGITINLQGVSLGFDFFTFTLVWRKSNLDSLTFE